MISALLASYRVKNVQITGVEAVGWEIGYDDSHDRDIGYGVPCRCEHPDCDQEIHRGLAHLCGGKLGSRCGLYFCYDHLYYIPENIKVDSDAICERCCENQAPFEAKPDLRKWVEHKLNNNSWCDWRSNNRARVKELTIWMQEAD
jgi:hypothetical protein